jgi:hypothetical protein
MVTLVLTTTALAMVLALQPVTDKAAMAQESDQTRATTSEKASKPAHLQATTATTVKRLNAPPKSKRIYASSLPNEPRWNCEDGECVCKGVVDCSKMIKSGVCDGLDVWEGEDPSVGGCDIPEKP